MENFLHTKSISIKNNLLTKCIKSKDITLNEGQLTQLKCRLYSKKVKDLTLQIISKTTLITWKTNSNFKKF